MDINDWEKLWVEAGFEMFDKVVENDGVELSSMNRKLIYPITFRFHVLGLFSKLLYRGTWVAVV